MSNLEDRGASSRGTEATSSAPPFFFPVSPLKLFVMSVGTWGIYEIYWFYKNWTLVKEREGSSIKALARALFTCFFCYALFKRIAQAGKDYSIERTIAPGALAAFWIALSLLYRLPDPYWLLAHFAPLLLVPAQLLANDVNSVVSPECDRNQRFTTGNVIAVVFGGLLFVLAVLGMFLPEE